MAEVEKISAYTMHNKTNILNSSECACVDCFHAFAPEDITYYIREKDSDETAVCPYCLNDTIVPNNIVNYTIEDIKRFHTLYLATEFDNTITEFKRLAKKDVNESDYFMNAKAYMGGNRVAVERSVNVICVNCVKSYPANNIVNYCGNTALCTDCNKKTIIPDWLSKPSWNDIRKYHNIKFVN